jgi:hypothetical protein
MTSNYSLLLKPLEEAARPMTPHIVESITTLATTLLVATGIVIAEPNMADAYSIIGAGFAACLGVVMAMMARKTRLECVAVFLSSIVVGLALPSISYLAAMHFSPKWVADLVNSLASSWQAWFFSGLVFGLTGWALVKAWQNWATRNAANLIHEAACEITKPK